MIRKEKNKTAPICRCHYGLHRNPKESQRKKSFELISAFSKFTDNKINIQKSIATMEKN